MGPLSLPRLLSGWRSRIAVAVVTAGGVTATLLFGTGLLAGAQSAPSGADLAQQYLAALAPAGSAISAAETKLKGLPVTATVAQVAAIVATLPKSLGPLEALTKAGGTGATLQRDVVGHYAEVTVCTSGSCGTNTYHSNWDITKEDRTTGHFSGTSTSSQGASGTFVGEVTGTRFTLSFSSVPPGYTSKDTAHIEQDGVISGTFTDSDGNAGDFTSTPDAS
jgi:hypothetical protein